MIRIFYIAVFVLASIASWGQQGMLLAAPADGEAEISTLLDDYPGAIAAYSTAKLSSTATNCVTIKRSSDGDTLVVGFSGNDFDAASAAAFVGANDAWVQTWWDQTGTGFNATQTDSTKMPLIYSSGTLVTENSIAAIDFDGTDDFLEHNLSGDSVATSFSFWGVLDTDEGQGFYRGIYATGESSGGFMVLKRVPTSSNWSTFGGIDYPSGTNINPSASSTLISMISSDGNSGTFYTDATSDGTFAATEGQTGRHIGGEESSGQNAEMQCQLILVYPTDESSNRTAIETIINNYFSIY